jgi:hypothetical protein
VPMRIVVVLAIGLVLGLGIALVIQQGGAPAPSAALAATPPGTPAAGVVRICSQGTVLTADGQIWFYRPDQDRWLTMDQAFKEEGRDTHIVPLPVPVAAVKEMESFGFILTQGGEIWFYEISTDKWRKLPTPA